MVNSMGGSAMDDAEIRHLNDSVVVIKQQAFYMKRALDEGNVREAISHAATMLGELQTSSLSPQKYYELYIKAFDELMHLELFFTEECKTKGRNPAELYEQVQYVLHVVPRLYLLCTVGSVYMRTKQAPVKEVLKDLVDMSRGVQHPLRGLFLRSYLSQVSKDKLPDTGSEYESDAGGHVEDAVDFVVQNFTEMNKLWVRMQHTQGGHGRDRQAREKERRELRDLVGKNLHVLSQLQGVDVATYRATVLPRVLEQVVNCKDEIAQSYLMDAIIQVFPDDFHLQTLDTLLEACPQLQPGVDLKTVLAQFMERLAEYAAGTPSALPVFDEVEAFEKLLGALPKVVASQPEMPQSRAVALYGSLAGFVLSVHKGRLDYLDRVLDACVDMLTRDGAGPLREPAAVKAVSALLAAPLAQYGNINTVLNLEHYPRLLALLPYGAGKSTALAIVRHVTERGTLVSSPDKVAKLFDFVSLLVRRDAPGAPSDDTVDPEDLEEEQTLVARLLHLLMADDPGTMFAILATAREQLLLGGPRRLPFTLPPLTFHALKLVRKLQQQGKGMGGSSTAAGGGSQVAAGDAQGGDVGEATQAPAGAAPAEGLSARGQVSLTQVLQFVHGTCASLVEVTHAELALRVLLLAATVACDCGLERVGSDLFVTACGVYEDEIADTRAQVTALQLLVGSLQQVGAQLTPDSRQPLLHKATLYAARLLRRVDQCRAMALCSHLFWSDDGRACNDEAG
eukprot:jgi/Mesvir1/21806/Mv04196-RA.3